MAHRDAARRPKFFIFDAWIGIFLLLFLLMQSWWAFLLLMASVVLQVYLHLTGFPITMLGRRLRTFLVGPVRSARPPTRRQMYRR